MPCTAFQLGRHYIQLLVLRAGVHDRLSHPSATETARQDWDPRSGLKTCLEQFLEFISNLRSDGTAEHWPPWCQNAFSSLGFALLFMFVSSSTFEEATSWLQLIGSARKQLRLKAESFKALRLGLLRIDSIFWRGIDQVLKLEPHVKLALEVSRQGA